MNKIKAKIKNNIPAFIITIVAVLGRIIAFILATPVIYQHDVKAASGHFDYAMYIFNNWQLADNNYYEFAQPPINAGLQAILMKFISLFKDYGDDYMALYANCKILSLIYSLITLYLFYKIIKEFDLPKNLFNIFYGIMALYPGLFVMTTQYSNDMLSYVFFYLSLYLCIRWAKKPKFSTIIFLALSIGLGMLTKISVGLIAFIVGPMMLAVLIHSIIMSGQQKSLAKKEVLNIKNKLGKESSNNVKPFIIVLQIVVFLIIVTPIGLSYSIRNYLMFGQGFGEISDVVKGTVFDMTLRSYSDTERYWTFAFSKLYDGKYDIFHDWTEYNIWVDLVKTSAFDEFQFREYPVYPALVVVWLYNIIFYFTTFIAMIYNIVTLIMAAVKKEIKNFAKNMLNLRLLSIMLYVLAIVSFLAFNLKYPYSCNSNYRYIAYILFALVGSLIVLLNDAEKIKNSTNTLLDKLFDDDNELPKNKKKVSTKKE